MVDNPEQARIPEHIAFPGPPRERVFDAPGPRKRVVDQLAGRRRQLLGAQHVGAVQLEKPLQWSAPLPPTGSAPEVVCAGEEGKRVHSPHSSTMTEDLTRILSFGAESRPGYRSTDLKVMSTTPNRTSSNPGLAKQLSTGSIPRCGESPVQ